MSPAVRQTWVWNICIIAEGVRKLDLPGGGGLPILAVSGLELIDYHAGIILFGGYRRRSHPRPSPSKSPAAIWR